MSFNNNEPTACLMGRFSPWNEGHEALIKHTLGLCDPDYKNKKSDARQVVLLVRDVGQDLDEIKDNVDDVISDFPEWVGYVECIKIPNVVDLFFGKQLTIDMHRLNLHEDVEPGYIEKTSAEDSAAQREFFRNRAG